MSSRWDFDALRAGGLVALVFAVPFSLAASWANSDAGGAVDDAGDRATTNPWAFWLSLGAVFGFFLGAGCAAWVQQRGLPLAHALVSAISTYVLAQTAFIIIELATGDTVNWFAALFNLSIVAGVSLVGGWFGGRLRRQGFLPSTAKSSSVWEP